MSSNQILHLFGSSFFFKFRLKEEKNLLRKAEEERQRVIREKQAKAAEMQSVHNSVLFIFVKCLT